jgi:GNAT superfamily N-acetyltransferase
VNAVVVSRFGPEHIAAFQALHRIAGWCFCVAWWVETWDGWGKRTAEDNLAVRERLCRTGIFDGYLALADGKAVGWCQALPRDRLKKIRNQFDLAPAESTWAIGCFYIHPEHRRQGLARHLLRAVLEDLPGRGARRVEAYPRRVPDADAGDLWNGPETLFAEFGFAVLKEDPVRPVLVRDLA